jgi:hypothetical protein
MPVSVISQMAREERGMPCLRTGTKQAKPSLDHYFQQMNCSRRLFLLLSLSLMFDLWHSAAHNGTAAAIARSGGRQPERAEICPASQDSASHISDMIYPETDAQRVAKTHGSAIEQFCEPESECAKAEPGLHQHQQASWKSLALMKRTTM